MIDTHCHLFIEDYPDIDEVIKKMGDNLIIVSGVDDDTNKQVLDLCLKYNNVYGTLGIHPENVDGVYNLEFISQHINDFHIVGIGEIGLDYHFCKDNKDKQISLFTEQIEIAISNNKPIVVHSRDAICDTYNIVKRYNYGSRTLIHCFSSSAEMALNFIKLGCKLGVGGVLTFKNSSKLQDVVSSVSLDNFVLETDSPYLTPEPLRGKRNEPYNVYYVGKRIAEIKNINLCDVLEKTTSNALDFFNI